jgi:ubiquinone/menaquinone biosynthesis C-methylase UbiE
MIASLWDNQVRKAFDSWARTYPKVAEAKIQSRGYSYTDLACLIWDCLGKPEQGVVFELGCGPGLVGRGLPIRTRDVTLVGIDISSAMLNQAPRCTYQLLIQASAESVPFAPRTAVGVFSCFMMHSIRDRRKSIMEIRRLLGPGGRCVIVDLFPATRGIPLWKWVARLVHSIWHEKGALSRYITQDQLVEELTHAGFRILEVKQLGEPKSYRHGLVSFCLPG